MNSRRARVRQRRGVAMIAALVCLLLVSTLVTAMLQSALQSRRQLRVEQNARQALLLLAAGAQHARQQVASNTGYEGETLRLEIPSQTEPREAEIEIHTTEVEQPPVTRVEIVVRFPVDSPPFVKRSLTFTVPQSSP